MINNLSFSFIKKRKDGFRASFLLFSLLLTITSLLIYIPKGHYALLSISVLPILFYSLLLFPTFYAQWFAAFAYFRIYDLVSIFHAVPLPRLFALALLASLTINVLVKRIRLYWTKELSYFALFAFFVTVSTATAISPGAALNAYINIFIKLTIIFLSIVWVFREKKDFDRLFNLFILSSFVLCYYTIYNKYFGLGTIATTRIGLQSEIGTNLSNPNELATILLFPLSIFLTITFMKPLSSSKKLVGLLGTGLVTYSILATQSRGGLIGMLVVFGLSLRKKIQSKILLLLILIVAAVFFYISADIANRAVGGLSETGLDTNAAGRIDAWKTGLNVLLIKPFTGIGLANFEIFFRLHPSFTIGKPKDFHSLWIEVLSTTGIFGFSAFVGLLFTCINKSIKSTLKLGALMGSKQDNEHARLYILSQAIYVTLVSYCINGLFISLGFSWALYILLALTISIHKYLENLMADQHFLPL